MLLLLITKDLYLNHITNEQAIDLGREIKDALVLGAELINNLKEDADVQSYIDLQQQLDKTLIKNMVNLGWVHKYYHMIYPDKIDAFHSTRWQRHALICSNIKPEKEDALYIMSGQLMQLIKKTKINSAHVMNSMVELFGEPANYFRIGTSSGDKSYWNEMLGNNYISIGWPKIGDLSIYNNDGKAKARAEIVSKLEKNYPNTPQVNGRNASQILSFYRNIEIGDIIVAANGEKILGIGQVSGEYKYIEGLDFPHTIPVNWIHVSNIRLPKPKEGLRNTLYQYKNLDNILEIERLSNVEKIQIYEDKNIITERLLPLSGISKDIESVLERKKQVIIYKINR